MAAVEKAHRARPRAEIGVNNLDVQVPVAVNRAIRTIDPAYERDATTAANTDSRARGVPIPEL
ncbi:hypothetical protein [Nocardia sp. NPDC005366]|uniref:hypothetical protein n=1 Tax=Nocardia sp. NPDC005366 TaxID=3156878 RepID=UPI0033A34A9D